MTDASGAAVPHPITNKREMYQRLAAGELGNTIPQFFSVGDWERSADYARYDLWGIRSMVAGGDRRMRLNVPRGEVGDLYRQWFRPGLGNISPMIDRHAVLRGEVIDTAVASPVGLHLSYVPPGMVNAADPWRGSFRDHGQQATGVAARLILSQYLWPADYEDLRLLLEQYPEHAIEFTVCDRAVGLVPCRNTVIWEVRRY